MQLTHLQAIVLLLLQTRVCSEDPFCSEFDDVECGLTANEHIFAQQPSIETSGYRDAKANTWPWQVSIRRKHSDGVFRHECAGTLVSKTDVLSAAHCLTFSDQVDDYEVQIGVHTLSEANIDGIFKIKLIAFPESTNLKKFQFPSDVMVISLDSPVKYSDSIRPACIGFVENGLQQATCYVVGWDNHVGDPIKSGSSTLKESRILLIEQETCQRDSGSTYDREKMICAKNDDICHSDPGEALVCYLNNKWRLYGIASFRPLCDKNMLYAQYSNMRGKSAFLAQCMLKFNEELKPANIIRNCSSRHERSGSKDYRILSGATTHTADVNNFSTTTETIKVDVDDKTCGVPEITPLTQGVDRETKIIGGYEARMNSWPWQVSLRRRQSNGEFRHECGGTLVSPTLVISAVHCLMFSDDPKDFQVQLGAHNISKTNNNVLIKVKQFAYPTDNKPRKMQFPSDIMLITLERSVTFTDKISPACLGYEDIDFSKVVCYTTGWGKHVTSMIRSETLQQLYVPVHTSDECRKHVSRKYSADKLMCAGSLAGGSDTCQGDDRGGPLVCQLDEKWRLYGIVSFGHKCAEANSPGVYTKVSGYLEFLQNYLPRFKFS